MTEVPKPVDVALDLLIYAPVGLALTAAEELPKMAAKGRTRIQEQLRIARLVGEFTVARGRQEVQKRFSPPPPPPAAPAAGPAHLNGSSPPAPPAPSVEVAPLAATGPVPGSSDLAIPGYDSLSASQVVQRLAGLEEDELSAVAAYERAHRARRTILNRIEQLRGH